MVERHVINQEQLENALHLQQRGNRFLGQILIGKGWGSEQQIYDALAEVLDVNCVRVDDVSIKQEIIRLVPELLAVTRDILPFDIRNKTLYLAMANPRDTDAIRIVEFITAKHVEALIAPPSQLQNTIRAYYNIKPKNGTHKPEPDDLELLGLSSEHLKRYREMLQQPQGWILVTGPAESGKTTTLYASLNTMKEDVTRDIVTIEDPIKYQLNGVKQIQIDHKAGLTYDSVLSFILGRDPNIHRDPSVILVEEIRDPEIADIAMRVVETGHLVLSTLHRKDAVSAVNHLFRLGIAPDLVASNLLGVIAQRLVRKICPQCKIPYIPDKQELRSLGLHNGQKSPHIYCKGTGCSDCGYTGYSGQIGLYEIFAPTEQLRAELAKRPTKPWLERLTREAGMKTILEDGIEKIRQGITTVEEVAKACCITCPGCEQAIVETEELCPFCQYPLHETCEQCGAKLDVEWLLCPFCGTQKPTA